MREYRKDSDYNAECLTECLTANIVVGFEHQHYIEYYPWHSECNVEVCSHELEVFVEVCGLLGRDQHCTACRADDEVSRVDDFRVVRRAEHCVRDDLGDHHDGEWPACANHVDELSLEDSERHAGGPECVDVREHHLSFFFIIVTPYVFFIHKNLFQTWLAEN